MLRFKCSRSCREAGAFAVLLYVLGSTASAANQAPARETVEVVIPTDRVQFQKAADGTASFSGDDVALTGETGAPALPTYCLKILLPPDADLKTVRVAVVGGSLADVPGAYDVPPMPPVMLRGKAIYPEGMKVEDGRSHEAYARTTYGPQSLLGMVLPGQMREWRFVEVEIHPYQYNPAAKSLRRFTGGSLSITYDRTPGLRALRTRSPEMAALFEATVKKAVINLTAFSSEYQRLQEEKR